MGRPVHDDLPLQHVTVGDGGTRRVAALQIEELIAAGVSEVALVVRPRVINALFPSCASKFGEALVSVEQREPRGFGDAVLCAEDWVAGEPFLVQVCESRFRDGHGGGRARVSSSRWRRAEAVRGGEADAHRRGGALHHPGLRQGTYLQFFGTHALTPGLFEILRAQKAALPPEGKLGLTEALAVLAVREKYLALEVDGQRVDLESPFGLLRAQLALALQGVRREEVLRLILEEVARAPASRG